MSDLRSRIEADERFLDSAIVSHGYAVHLRDYDVVIEVPGVAGRFRYRFIHCPECHVTTAVSDESWRRSWDDVLIDYEAWEAAGSPDGYVWGVGWSEAYPGLSYVAGSALAASWSERLGRDLHEIAVDSNAFTVRLIAADMVVQQVDSGGAVTGAFTPNEE